MGQNRAYSRSRWQGGETNVMNMNIEVNPAYYSEYMEYDYT